MSVPVRRCRSAPVAARLAVSEARQAPLGQGRHGGLIGLGQRRHLGRPAPELRPLELVGRGEQSLDRRSILMRGLVDRPDRRSRAWKLCHLGRGSSLAGLAKMGHEAVSLRREPFRRDPEESGDGKLVGHGRSR